jgi:murein DD-endopeptidase MepM/ murein hydrolase activator NlpD
MAIPIIAARSLNIAKNLIVSSKVMAKGAYSSVSSTISRTGEKIKSTNAKIVAEKNKQADINRKKSENESRAAKENNVENTNKKKGAVLGLVGVVKKSIMGFWKIIGAWLLDNLPRIIEEVRKFVKKVRIVGAAIKRAVSLVGSVFSSIGKIAKAVVKNILNFDFTDKSGEIREAREELDASVDGIGSSIIEIGTVWGREEDELDYILTQLTGNQNLENIRKNILSEFPEVEKGTSAVGDGSSPSSGGGSSNGGWKPILELIAKAESVGGSYDSIYPNSIKPGLSDMTIGEADAWQARTAKQRGSAAAGRYQFMNIKEQAANYAGLSPNDKFSPENQDKMAIGLIEKKRKVTLDMVKDNPVEAAKRLSMEWAGLPVLESTMGRSRQVSAGQSFYSGDSVNKATVSGDELRGAFKTTTSTENQISQPQAPQPANGSTGTTVNDEYKGGMSKTIVKTSGYGMRTHPISGARKMHMGIDIAPPGPGYKVALKVPGKVTRVGSDGRGYGNFVIITSQQTGMSYMFAHLKSVYVRQGDTYTGQAIGEIGNTGAGTGIHLHYEVYKGGKDGPEVNPEPYRHLLSIGKGISKQKAATTNSNNLSSAKSEELTQIASRRTGGTQIVNNTTLLKQDRIILKD